MKVSQGGWKGLGALVVGALVVAAAGCATTEPAKAPAAAAPAAASAHALTKMKVQWVDLKNSALLLECTDSNVCKGIHSKKGESHTFVIPDALKPAAGSWKEDSLVNITFEDRAEGGRTVKTVEAAK